MQTIWKFELPMSNDTQVIYMPVGAKPLCVHEQRGKVQIWAFVNDDAQVKPRTFYIRGTGQNCDGMDGKDYVGTFEALAGLLVLHLFAEPEEP